MGFSHSAMPVRRVVRLHEQGLHELPPAVFEPHGSLGSLQCPGNRFDSFPAGLRDQVSLTDVSFADNQLTSIDASILGSLSALRALTLTSNCITDIPEDIANLTALELLALGHNRLRALPLRLSECTALRTLTLSNNDIASIADETLHGLQSLRTLRLDRNPRLAALPDAVCGLSKLEALNLAWCSLCELPTALGALTALSTLQANDNCLTTLPSSMGSLKRLRTLALEGNRLISVPEELTSGCTALRALTLSVNRLTALPPLDGLVVLQELRLDDNPLTALPARLPPAVRILGLSVCSAVKILPESVGELTHLTQLAIGAARLSELPRRLVDLTSLTTLQLSGNVLARLPDDLAGLAALTTLEVTDNRLVSLPHTVCELPRLVTLRVSENRLTALPDGLGCLGGSLTALCASANELAQLPDSIGQLLRLQVLEAASNFLTSLPSSVGALHCLRRLILDANCLEAVPASLAQLTLLEELGLAHNRLDHLPTGLFTRASDGMLGARLRLLRLQANAFGCPPETSHLAVLDEPPLLFGNRFAFDPSTSTCAGPAAATVDISEARTPPSPPPPPPPPPLPPPPLPPRVPVALLLPGLVRSYAHGTHWKRFVDALSTSYEVRVYLCVWDISGAPSNHFAQAADKAAAAPVDAAALASCYPTAVRTRLVDAATHWVDKDREGFDGRYINQWRMVRRCWELMQQDEDEMDALHSSTDAPACAYERSQFVIRGRPDLRVHALPLRLEGRGGAYLAMQERLWGSDNFFFGDTASMRAVCSEVAPRYEEYTRTLGQASSEPMLAHHLEVEGLAGRVVRFARCVSVDRSSSTPPPVKVKSKE